jgi:hypothetical protein
MARADLQRLLAADIRKHTEVARTLKIPPVD